MSRENLENYMRGRWPRTWKLISVNYSTIRYSLSALGKYVSVDFRSDYTVMFELNWALNYDIKFPEMDIFEQHFDEICRSIDPGNSADKYAHCSKFIKKEPDHMLYGVRITPMRLLITFGGVDMLLSHCAINGDYGFYANKLEKFLARAYNQRKCACAEIVTLLPQPIAEEIAENF